MTGDPIPMAALRTGVSVPAGVATTVDMVVRLWLGDGVGGTLLFYDAVSLARDATYKPFGPNGAALLDAGFTTPGGAMDRTVRDILLACADGEGLALSYVSPMEVSHG